MRPINPYREIAALVDVTRKLDPEEEAELHLEQGFVERAFMIYAALAVAHPEVPYYRDRRDWLRRLAASSSPPAPRTDLRPPAGPPPEDAPPPLASAERTLRGYPSPVLRPAVPTAARRAPRPVSWVRRLPIVGVE